MSQENQKDIVQIIKDYIDKGQFDALLTYVSTNLARKMNTLLNLDPTEVLAVGVKEVSNKYYTLSIVLKSGIVINIDLVKLVLTIEKL